MADDALNICLYGQPIGTLLALPNDRSIFAFHEDYMENPNRPTLSLSFKNDEGRFLHKSRSYQTKLEPFFANLLPEGTLRAFIAQKAGVKDMRDYPLLSLLGRDLPGAVTALPYEAEASINIIQTDNNTPISDNETPQQQPALHFSLAGVQLKFSGLQKSDQKHGGLVIPANGAGGDWIIKLPSPHHAQLPECEWATMTLAAILGMNVPEINLVNIADIEGIPEGIKAFGETAYAIKRFDRSKDSAIHMEDFAQVFGVYPDDKYQKARYHNILSVLAIEGEEGDWVEFIRRLTFMVLIGNGDMHLKNWSLIYPDRINARLAPAYDFIPTIGYMSDDLSALKFIKSHNWQEFDYAMIEKMANFAKLPAHMLAQIAKDTVAHFDDIWAQESQNLPYPSHVRNAIERHRSSLNI